jgi:ankyrin repeat protein
MVQLLLDFGADAASVNKEGKTALIIASGLGHVEIVNTLLEAARWILQRGPDLHQRAGAGLTALHLAACKANVQYTIDLLQAGSDVNATSMDGSSPLSLAVGQGRVENARALLAARADPSLGPNGYAALHVTVALQKEDLVRVLLGCDRTVVGLKSSDFGYSALHLACFRGSNALVTLLLGHKAPIDSLDTAMGTPLHMACQYRHPKIVAKLLEHGADQTLYDCLGRLPSDYTFDDASISALFSNVSKKLTNKAFQKDVSRRSVIRFAQNIRNSENKCRARASFNSLARCLLVLQELESAQIAFEQMIITNDNRATVEFDFSNCDLCPREGNILGPMYICRECTMCAVCESCVAKYRAGSHPRFCSHNNFVVAPRKIWKDLKSGTVDQEGRSVLAWLSDLEVVVMEKGTLKEAT